MKELEKILFVEDDLDIQQIAQIAIEAVGGYQVKIANHGQEALDILKEGYDPQMVVTDMMMPTMDGLTLLEELKRDPQYAHLPVVFMTAKINSNEINQYVELGAQSVITKPFDPMGLAQELASIWGAAQDE